MKALKNILRGAFARIDHMSIGLLPFFRLAGSVTGRYRIPVLVYHKVTRDAETASQLTCAVSTAQFVRQMAWLDADGFEPISIQTYTGCLVGRRPFPRRSLLITFDDGYRSVYTRAYAVLKKYNYPAVVFLTTDFIGGSRWFPSDEKYRDLPAAVQDELEPLTWEEVREMTPLVTAGSHSVSHPRLGTLARAETDREVRQSKEQIEARLGTECVWFAYPHGIQHHGDYSDESRTALLEAGYRVAFNSEIGRNAPHDDPYTQNRIEAGDKDSHLLLKAKLLGGYDWVGVAQSTFHRVFAPDSSR